VLEFNEFIWNVSIVSNFQALMAIVLSQFLLLILDGISELCEAEGHVMIWWVQSHVEAGMEAAATRRGIVSCCPGE
jgi:hypothetical protein